MSESTPDLLGRAVAPMLAQLDARAQKALLALLERQAAATYRRLAGEAAGREAGASLLTAAANEDAIARTLEALDPDHARIEQDLHARFPELDGLFDTVLKGRDYADQLRLQQAAELGAAELFRALAEAEGDPDTRRKLLDCAGKEHENAAVLRVQLT
jgi:rubrerythrin